MGTVILPADLVNGFLLTVDAHSAPVCPGAFQSDYLVSNIQTWRGSNQAIGPQQGGILLSVVLTAS